MFVFVLKSDYKCVNADTIDLHGQALVWELLENMEEAASLTQADEWCEECCGRLITDTLAGTRW